MAYALIIGLALSALGAGVEYENTQSTAKKEDQQAAQSILDQTNIQKKANTRVQQTIQQLQQSNANDARTQRLADYMQTLQGAKARTNAGLTDQLVGGQAFQQDAADAAQNVDNYGAQTAGLVSRIDAPTVQRQQEGFDYGQLATDLDLLQSQSQSQAFLDQLRQKSIRRNPNMDLAAGLLSSAGGAVGGMGGSVSDDDLAAYNNTVLKGGKNYFNNYANWKGWKGAQ